MTILDSNIWIALFHKEDSQHLKAQALMKKLTMPIVLPEYVLLEVCTVLRIRADQNHVRTFVEVVSDNRDIEILPSTPELLRSTITRLQSLKTTPLSFTDVALLLLSKTFMIETFDRHLQTAIKKNKILLT
ncbi:type II toxin-antitoxin system VapC family toxin [Candidatus Uhrbacteria bacterium]|nr:type II toxin-antitoxin system VapC family toxin [Candidatus Uhrbacteria bacterium]